MTAHDAREALFLDLVAGRVEGDALRDRVAALARMTGVPAGTVLLDLYVEAFGVA